MQTGRHAEEIVAREDYECAKFSDSLSLRYHNYPRLCNRKGI